MGAKSELRGARPAISGAVIVDPARCSGCRLCEMVCTLSHDGDVAPAWARLRVERDCFTEPLPKISLCRQCADAECVDACPAAAMASDPSTGAPVVDAQACTACGLCVEGCPHGMIRLSSVEPRRALKCDLCGGQPRCVEHCPQRALTYAPRGA